jgi:hypothetical protein
MTALAVALGCWGLGAVAPLMARGRSGGAVLGAAFAVAGGLAGAIAGGRALGGAARQWSAPWSVPGGALALLFLPGLGR